MEKKDVLRRIPGVDTLLQEPELKLLSRQMGKQTVTSVIREELEKVRKKIISCENPEEGEALLSGLRQQIRIQVEKKSHSSFQRVINAAGILLHTNLGRAPLGTRQIEAAYQAMTGYCNLEYELEEGKRGKRQSHYQKLICQVTGGEAAVAVNNNAAAVTLILAALARNREVVVSRGELVEIGGHFRIPEVMEESGSILRETGCTNRTRIEDYRKAVTENTAALLKVHTSNYKIVGFTESPSVEELASAGKEYHIPVIVDLGSGVLVNLEKFGLPHEPTVREMLEKGADIVCFSGDKLLGGPQAGIITGKKKYIEKIENHPLMRAMRLDKCTTAVLEATFREYLDEENAWENIPILKLIRRQKEELKIQAEEIKKALLESGFRGEIQVQEDTSMIGGGSLPGETLSDVAVSIKPEKESTEEFAARLRMQSVPVIVQIKNNRVFLHMRTVFAEEKEILTEMLKEALLSGGCL